LRQEGRTKYYNVCKTKQKVFIHPTSYLYSSQPETVVYTQLHETSRVYMKGITAIELNWLPVVAKPLCTFSKPLELPLPRYFHTHSILNFSDTIQKRIESSAL
jgi:ATP-dependent RNA helicase DHX37/DHR1